MSELTVAGQRIGRISDASSPELLPPETPLDMPDQDFKTRGAGPQRLRRGYWDNRFEIEAREFAEDNLYRFRALLRRSAEQ